MSDCKLEIRMTINSCCNDSGVVKIPKVKIDDLSAKNVRKLNEKNRKF